MKRYVDGFVIPVPKKNLQEYHRMAQKAGKIWMEYGALQFVETVGDDLKVEKWALAFPQMVKPKRGEVVLFSWILYKSKADRDRINKKAMADPRLKGDMDKKMPFDVKRMAYGGFETIVNLEGKGKK